MASKKTIKRLSLQLGMQRPLKIYYRFQKIVSEPSSFYKTMQRGGLQIKKPEMVSREILLMRYIAVVLR